VLFEGESAVTVDEGEVRLALPEPDLELQIEFSVYLGGPAAVPRTLLDILSYSVTTWPNALALDDGGRALTYRELDGEVRELAGILISQGIGSRDRVGVRVPSGSADLYVAILAILTAGAAYVPVDVDDPDERAELVWREADVCAVLGTGLTITRRGSRPPAGGAGIGEDAWIIFTSGSTGTPKGVAVSHVSAAAFVDAEARLFLRDAPIGPGDRVLAGLSVAFDASCEEMWLAWRNGACLVPAPRALVRTGADLGPWLAERQITVVSTVPTLAALWSPDMLAAVRLLIVGGEACPPEVVRRFAVDGREVWNTYGPTEATVVACAARLRAGEPVRIGLPLAGWDLAVVDAQGEPVPWQGVGELVIGGVGLGRYLDPVKDAEKFAPLPALGWSRAYRTGDLVRAIPAGLEFVGRADDQVKLGGRRIELGEIDAALLCVPSVAAATSMVRRTAGGLDVLVGYVVPVDGDPDRFDRDAALRLLRDRLPAALVPRLAVLPEFPVRGSGKVDKTKLPWPLPSSGAVATGALDETTVWLLDLWRELLGSEVRPDDDFFELGGTSLAAARLVSLMRERFPEVSVAEVYRYPTPAALRARLSGRSEPVSHRRVERTPHWTGWVQAAVQLALWTVTGVRWIIALGLLQNICALVLPESWLPAMPWWLAVSGWVLLFSGPGRMATGVLGVRAVRGRLRPGTYRRGGWTHLRLWTAERIAGTFGLAAVVGTPLAGWFARLLGCTVGAGVDLHALPPVTGLASFGDGAAVEPEADLSGWWLDGDELHVGFLRIGAGAQIGTRTTLMPGADIGSGAQVLAGSCVAGTVPAGQCWGGSPAVRQESSAPRWPVEAAPRSRAWQVVYSLTGPMRGLVLLAGAIPVVALAMMVVPGNDSLAAAARALLVWMPAMTALGLVGEALLLLALVRIAGRVLRPGTHPLHSKAGWAAWFTHELMQMARTTLFPLYASLFTPVWLRCLGARIGRSVELSTVLTLPKLLTVDDLAFLADDVLAAPYELRRGWTRLGVSNVGSRTFVGNSGIVGPDRTASDGALIGVLSTTPEDVPAGTSWLGRPPMLLPRQAEEHDRERTYAPRRSLVLARSMVELCRLVPVLLNGLLGLAVFEGLDFLWTDIGIVPALLLSGGLLAVAGLVAGGVATAAKWLLMGRFSVGRHPLWSPFVWRNELYDTFVETLAVPWLVQPSTGTPLLNWWLRSVGARIGAGAWVETHWLPEPDLIEVAAGSSVNRGCVLQTHLFHDRVMRLDRVILEAGATLGPHGIVLPGSRLKEASTVEAGSLVMAGEAVPGHSRWQGTPIAPRASKAA
jgi:non-ribosomal peptide synthetase-like protein